MKECTWQFVFSRPFNAVNSMITTARSTIPPAFLINFSAADMVPPVASKSSIISTCWPDLMLPHCNSNVSCNLRLSYCEHFNNWIKQILQFHTPKYIQLDDILLVIYPFFWLEYKQFLIRQRWVNWIKIHGHLVQQQHQYLDSFSCNVIRANLSKLNKLRHVLTQRINL